MIDVYGALEMYLLEDEELGYVSGGLTGDELMDICLNCDVFHIEWLGDICENCDYLIQYTYRK